jgi:choloylglycine hydrolase
MKRAGTSAACVVLVLATLMAAGAAACTRVVYLGKDGKIVTARSMDWNGDIRTNLWIMPRGIGRSGEAGRNSVKWTAKYGSVVASADNIITTDGVNEAGLAANLLWLSESRYPVPGPGKPGLTIAAWAQYVLDNFATVREAVTALSQEPLIVFSGKLPDNTRQVALHLSISNPTGDSAVIEYIEGKQVIHHDRKFQTMTNSPVFEQQLALNEYWKQIGGGVMLPGTTRPADRYARASFLINPIPQDQEPERTIASVFGVIRSVSVPLGLSTPNEPEVAATRWRTVVDHKRKLYFFESAMMPNIFWIDLKAIDFSAGSGVRSLDLGPNEERLLSGDATKEFKPAKPFEFMSVR